MAVGCPGYLWKEGRPIFQCLSRLSFYVAEENCAPELKPPILISSDRTKKGICLLGSVPGISGFRDTLSN